MIKKFVLLLSTLLLASCGTGTDSSGRGWIESSSDQPVTSSAIPSSVVPSSEAPKSSSVAPVSSSVPASSSSKPSPFCPPFYTTFQELFPYTSDISLETICGVKIIEGYREPWNNYEEMKIYRSECILVASYYVGLLDVPLTKTCEFFETNIYKTIIYEMSDGDELSITFFNGGYIRYGCSSYVLDWCRINLLNIEFDITEWFDFDGLFTLVDELFGE